MKIVREAVLTLTLDELAEVLQHGLVVHDGFDYEQRAALDGLRLAAVFLNGGEVVFRYLAVEAVTT